MIGRATVNELLRRGHQVRLFSRGAAEDARDWSDGVEPCPGDVADARSVHRVADGCDVVLHIAGIVTESPPESTYETVNIDGTANMVTEAERAGVRRFIFVSSLGSARGRSGYHRSKVAAEEVTRQFNGSWCIVRTGAVFGPGDETLSVLLRMVRTLPAVPLIEAGDQPFQPVWHEDVGAALAACATRDDIAGRILRVAGAEVITVSELLDVFEELTGRDPIRVSLPTFLARVGSALASAVGVETPVSAATVQMLLEGNYLRADEPNDLTDLLGVTPDPLRDRLAQLADLLPEQTPDIGVGPLQRRRFWVDIHDTRHNAAALLNMLRNRFAQIVPFETTAEPGTPDDIREGATLTLALPARGHVQVRVERVDESSFTLATLEGHPLAGIVRFRTQDRNGGVVRFAIDVVERPASRLDQLSMALVGHAAQKRTWIQTAERVVAHSGGNAPAGVLDESWAMGDTEAEPVEEWARELVSGRRRRSENV